MTPARLTVVVVSRGLESMLDHCLDCLQSALADCNRYLESWTIALVDNASQPPYRAADWQQAGLHIVRVDGHHSYAAANNLAAARFPADEYLLLNNDVFLCRRALPEMLDVLASQNNVGICGARLLFPDGTLQHSGVVFGGEGKGPFHYLRGVDHRIAPTADRDFQAVTGACMLVRHNVWAPLDGLDEAYAFGLEDIDLCLRARQSGWRVVCCNRSRSLHLESMTPGRVELDAGSRDLFMQRWQHRYTVDG